MVVAGMLLIAVTGMDRLCAALRMLKVPKLLVLQILLTYRYLSVLVEEVASMVRAYSFRAPGRKGIHQKGWGSFIGMVFLRTVDRAGRIYEAMVLRGFRGEYLTGDSKKPGWMDGFYFIGWSGFFILARMVNIPQWIGSLVMGVF